MNELSQSEYDSTIREMAENVIDLMNESEAETRREWDEEWSENVWLEVENCTLRYRESNFPPIIEYSGSPRSPENYEDDAQLVREMMEDDVIGVMRALPHSLNPPSE